MTGVVLETLSNRKLIVFGAVLLLIQIGFFLIGGLIAPAPNNVQPLTSNHCRDRHHNRDEWFYTRPRGGNCERIQSLDELFDARDAKDHVTADDIVFVFQFPNPRDGHELSMSRLHQTMLSVFTLSIGFDESYPANGFETVLTMDVRLGYTHDVGKLHANWTEVARSTEDRPLQCTVNKNESGYDMDCNLLPLFELGSVQHAQYLLNIRLPSSSGDDSEMRNDLRKLQEISVYVIHPNGGFTVVWLTVKTLVFPVIAITLVWFMWRVSHLDRKPNVLEQTLMALGVALTILNIPVDWLSLVVHMPFMVLYSDIRQGIFYSVLLCFWIIFAGEHMMDQLERNHVLYYWKHLTAVGFGCICLFVFEMCERGVQLTNPFYSIWATKSGRSLGLAFIILAGIAACCYFIFLLTMVVRVFRNILSKKSALPSMSKPRRNFYLGLIYRFSFLMVFTLLCAALTVILFIVGNVSEGHWKWDERTYLEYTSAVQTGVYGMWNIYVFCLLIFYAPSTKYMAVADADEQSAEETVEFSTIPSEASVLAAFVQKSTID